MSRVQLLVISFSSLFGAYYTSRYYFTAEGCLNFPRSVCVPTPFQSISVGSELWVSSLVGDVADTHLIPRHLITKAFSIAAWINIVSMLALTLSLTMLHFSEGRMSTRFFRRGSCRRSEFFPFLLLSVSTALTLCQISLIAELLDPPADGPVESLTRVDHRHEEIPGVLVFTKWRALGWFSVSYNSLPLNQLRSHSPNYSRGCCSWGSI